MKKFLTIVAIFVSVLSASSSFAQVQLNENYKPDNLDEDLATSVEDVKSVQRIAGLLISPFLQIAAGVAIFFIVLGGFQWVTAMGNQEKIEGGKKTLTWAVIGFLVIMFSYLIVQIVVRTVYEETQAPPPQEENNNP